MKWEWLWMLMCFLLVLGIGDARRKRDAALAARDVAEKQSWMFLDEVERVGKARDSDRRTWEAERLELLAVIGKCTPMKGN